MKARYALTFVAALAVVLVANHEARADPIHWSYTSGIVGIDGSPTGTPGVVYAQENVTGVTSQVGSGSFTGPFFSPLTTASGSFTGPSKILITNLWPFDFDKSPNAGPTNFVLGRYSVWVSITDTASQRQNWPFGFQGTLSGSITPTGYSIGNTFSGQTTELGFLGNNIYIVSIGPFVAPTGPEIQTNGVLPTGVQPGSISAFVNVYPDPEPSTLALAGMGLGCLAVARLLSHRRAIHRCGHRRCG